MMKRSHVAIGLLATVAVNRYTGLPILWTLGGAALGSVLPDFDLRLGIPHRGVTHWLVWPALILFLWPASPLLAGLGFGWLLHILADALTVEGLRLWPSRLRVHGPAKTGKLSEYLLLIPLLMALLVVIIR